MPIRIIRLRRRRSVGGGEPAVVLVPEVSTEGALDAVRGSVSMLVRKQDCGLRTED
jgi:hypothetical protein